MRTGRPSCARSGSGRDQGSGPWPAPEGHRPGQADRTSGPTAHGYPWGRADARRARARDVAGNPGTPLTITSGLARFSWITPSWLRNLRAPGTSHASGRRTSCGNVTASLAVLGRVERGPVGFQRRFDLLQDVAMLSGGPAPSYVAPSTQEQIGYLQPQRGFGWRSHQHFLDRRAYIFVLFHIFHPCYVAPDSGRSCSRLESVDWIARRTPSPPKSAPTAVNGQAMRRRKRAPSNDTPKRAPLAATAMACSWVRRGAVPF